MTKADAVDMSLTSTPNTQKKVVKSVVDSQALARAYGAKGGQASWRKRQANMQRDAARDID